ncbi:transglutaminase TgpA family protein, partial [Microbacterium sp. zg.Y909]|uniref:transglutaminase TgpA family protein n=1 Tax=Microbacterium sp. zg.Y909 TaxID=2969413 RepID=UPI00214B0F60
FAVLAVAVLFLLRTETRARETAGDAPAVPRPGSSARRAGAGATAVGIGAIAVVVAITVTPLLPTPTARPAAGGLGATTTIDPSLNLGADLRQPISVPVMNVRSNTPVPPYLRVATLSSFDGAQWRPDRVRTLPLEAVVEDDAGGEGSSPFGEVEVDESLRVTAYRTTVEVTNLSSSWLPVAYPAVGVTGLDEGWEAMPYNRTVVSDSATSQGQVYEVLTHLPRPTREQIRATAAGGTVLRDASYDLPDVPMDIITQTTLQVTAGAETDYDKLVALQSWFRGGDFTYSLRAPVQQGFDGSGIDAIEQFLVSREGYCVHFASAFAVMARTLDMPARIVVGYLPGTGNGEVVDGETEYQVTSDQLHAWPEVHFAGIGWVPFEPTKSLGTPTSFLPERVAAADDAGEDVNEGLDPAAGAEPDLVAPEPSIAPEVGDQAVPDAAAPPLLTLSSALTALGVLIALMLPALVRELLRRRRLAAAAAGDAAAAWLSVREAAVDLGIAVPAAESPRAFGARLVADHGAPADAVARLVAAIERASYAAPARGSTGAGGPGDVGRESLADAAASVHAGLAAATPRGTRVRSLLMPRSLVVRPGSAYAAERVPI